MDSTRRLFTFPVAAVAALAIGGHAIAGGGVVDPEECTDNSLGSATGPVGPVCLINPTTGEFNQITYTFSIFVGPEPACNVIDIEGYFCDPGMNPAGDPQANCDLLNPSGFSLDPDGEQDFLPGPNPVLVYTINPAHIVGNTITARGFGFGTALTGFDEPATASSQITKTVLIPELTITKDADTARICEGDPQDVTYSYEVCNVGNTSMTNIVVNDPDCAPIDVPPGQGPGDTLGVGGCWTFTCTTEVSDEVTNIASVTGTSVLPDAQLGVQCPAEEVFSNPVTVNVNDNPIVEVVGAKICASDESDDLCAIVTGGEAPYDVAWFDNGTLIDQCFDVPEGGQCCIEVDDEETYTAVAVDQNGCEGEDSGNIDINPNPMVTVVPDKVCDGECGELSAVVNGGTAPYCVQWFDSLGKPVGEPCCELGDNEACTLSPVCDDEAYTAVATDSSTPACVGENFGSIDFNPVPTCHINSTRDKICDGQTATMCAIVEGGKPPYSYSWDVDGGHTNVCLWDIGESGTYTVTVTDDNGCSTECEFTLEPHEVEAVITCEELPDGGIQLCADDSIGRGPFAYKWSTAENDECIIVPDTAPWCIKYVVTVTDSNDCDDTVEIILEEGPGGECSCPNSNCNDDPCPADLNDDGVVNVADLLLLLGKFGPCPGCPSDLNCDGVVNVADLLILLGVFGPCPE